MRSVLQVSWHMDSHRAHTPESESEPRADSERDSEHDHDRHGRYQKRRSHSDLAKTAAVDEQAVRGGG